MAAARTAVEARLEHEEARLSAPVQMARGAMYTVFLFAEGTDHLGRRGVWGDQRRHVGILG